MLSQITADDSAPAETAAAGTQYYLTTHGVLTSILNAHPLASDIIFSPGRSPQAELLGQLVPVDIAGLASLSAEDTARIAADIMGENLHARDKLRADGSCDLSYTLPGVSRFRVNIFSQRGSYAVVMRVIPNTIPTFETLKLPSQLAEITNLLNGIVLVTGPTGSGKSSTLAAILDKINEEKAYHIITIEDPIEFLHQHKKATVHQRELYSDTPTFALALHAALRQAPKMILVGEMRDQDTIETALEAAETGVVVFSTLHTIDASKTVERIVGVFPLSEQSFIRHRFSKSFRYVISQRLMPSRDGKARVAAFEILKSTSRTRDYVEAGESDGKTLVDAMRDGELEGMQHFDGILEKMVRAGAISLETGLAYSTNAGNLQLQVADLGESAAQSPARRH
ncbi:MAG TPA: PilT/PilU family type 4a pilus ATPase [Terriglobia bacterium]|nr:PilT/PilU family type 4a pilus ATPase [Terriglobia bacterium]